MQESDYFLYIKHNAEHHWPTFDRSSTLQKARSRQQYNEKKNHKQIINIFCILHNDWSVR